MRGNDLLLRLRALAFWKRVERELDEELQFHLAMESRKNARPAQAMRSRPGWRVSILVGSIRSRKNAARSAVLS